MTNYPKACIAGAGSSGLTTAKALKERGIPFDCFEMSDNIGGNWYFNNPNRRSSAYELLHIDTSKSRMQFSDFPMPEEYPNFAHHSQVFAYFNAYCDHFGLRDRITFNTEVKHAIRDDQGLWQVELGNGETRAYDAFFVCNGHHWDPRMPEPAFPGHFDGEQLHSHHYKSAAPYRGKRVLVLGMGNSAMDISVETSYVAEKVFLAARRGAYVIPKYLFGKPIDTWVMPVFPYWINRIILGFMLRLQVGRPEDYGLQTPDHKLLEAHPSMSSTLLDRLAHGEVTPKPNIAELQGDSVKFVDGSVEKVDTIIYSTGYKVSFPFFDTTFIAAEDNDLPLYLRMMKPGLENLFFIGLYQPLGAIFPIAEVQAGIAADYLRGDYALPTAQEMEAQIEKERAAMFKRYVKSKRHTMQVDFDPFMVQLRREHLRGKDRARASGNRLPVAARSGSLAPAAR
ncbi:MAG: NAD(P)-binding domain-containing protein [Candidatus Hydrogenedentes bacterium]|nr:NAD(P)-binding domain-containing protein [Candidatus Hydrogenedentota bacterium]